MENSVRYSSGSGFCRFFRAGLDEEDIMTSKEIRIGLSSGLEARPAAMLVQVASQYESSIYVESEEKRVNAKSIMGMMTLGLAEGAHVKVTADGSDEEILLFHYPMCLVSVYLQQRSHSLFVYVSPVNIAYSY